ncbi:MAG: hypothetical protein Q9190_002266 [Brigantiaea leucoxantha]
MYYLDDAQEMIRFSSGGFLLTYGQCHDIFNHVLTFLDSKVSRWNYALYGAVLRNHQPGIEFSVTKIPRERLHLTVGSWELEGSQYPVRRLHRGGVRAIIDHMRMWCLHHNFESVIPRYESPKFASEAVFIGMSFSPVGPAAHSWRDINFGQLLTILDGWKNHIETQ